MDERIDRFKYGIVFDPKSLYNNNDNNDYGMMIFHGFVSY